MRTSNGSEPRMWAMLISDMHGVPAPTPCPEPDLATLGVAVGAPAAPAVGASGGPAACQIDSRRLRHLRSAYYV